MFRVSTTFRCSKPQLTTSNNKSSSLTGSGLRNIIDPYFRKLGKFPTVVTELLEGEVVAGFVASGFGIGIVPNTALLDKMPVEELDVENKSMGRDIYMVLTESQDISPILKEFYDYAAKHPDPLLLVQEGYRHEGELAGH